MINNIITINKTKNHHTSLNTKKRKETRAYDVGNWDSGLGQALNVARLNLLIGFQPFPLNMFRLWYQPFPLNKFRLWFQPFPLNMFRLWFQPFPLNMFRLCYLHLAHLVYTMHKVKIICIRYMYLYKYTVRLN